MPEERTIPITEVPVKLEDQVIELVLIEVARQEEIIRTVAAAGRCCPIRQRHVARNLRRNRIDAVRRNDIAWERISDRIAGGIGPDGNRIVDGDRLARGSDQLRE